MALASGDRLGAYEVVSLLGAGGMGEVYRARDSRLGRDVAIKVLPAAVAADPERLARFEQEARATAALNHPNILAVHDIGNASGVVYVVSELLEGETLRDALTHGPVAIRQAVDYAVQIAHGLAAAHEKGIVHRDLKPENVFVTRDGRVKILDFGLAKLVETMPAFAGTMMATTPVSAAGVIVGTVGYMSPEQVRGLPIDHRADIFAFGAILYELLTGERAFSGESSADTISAILKEDPPQLANPAKIGSPALQRIVQRCLEKKPEQRFHSAHDLAFALSGSGSSSTLDASLSGGSSRRGRVWMPWVVTAATVVAAAGFVLFRRPPTDSTTKRVVRFTMVAPRGYAWSYGNPSPALSPDGTAVVYSMHQMGGRATLWLRRFDSLEPRILRGTEDGASPFWSPDGREVAFFAGSTLKAIRLGDGLVRQIGEFRDSPPNTGGAWGQRGDIIVPAASPPRLLRVAAAGGAITAVSQTFEAGARPRWPAFLPDGDHFFFVVDEAIYLASLSDTSRQRVAASESQPSYVSPGFLVFARNGALVAQRFDPTARALSGDSETVIDKVGTVYGRGAFATSSNGTLVYKIGGGIGSDITRLKWFGRDGREIDDTGLPAAAYVNPALSADGRRMAFGRADTAAGHDVWVFDFSRRALSRLTFEPRNDFLPLWSTDGSRMVFTSQRTAAPGLYERASNGAGEERLILKGLPGDTAVASAWSRDGRFIVVSQHNDILTLPASGGEPVPYLATPAVETLGRLSADDRWMAYQSDESGRPEIYVRPFPTASAGKWQVTTQGGTEAIWRRDGKELFYISPDRRLMSVTVGPGPTFAAPVSLFAAEIADAVFNYSAMPDGQKFMVNVRAGEASIDDSYIVVLNWSETLKK